MGGKQHLVKQLLQLIPAHKIYVEPFAGGASLFFAKAPSEVEVLNDIDGELVNLFMVVRDHPENFVRHVASLPYSRELYERWQRQLKNGTLRSNNIERSARFYFLLRASFFGHVEKGWRFALKTSEASRIYNSIGEIEAIARRLQDVYIDGLDFRRCLKNWDREDAFFYIDPPYFDSTPYRRGLPEFTLKDHQDLATLARSLRGRWLLTYNDCAEVRRLYTGFGTAHVSTCLNTHKVPNGEHRRRLNQLIICNYPFKELTEASS
jgi:DNA adenine methylase